MPSNVATVTSTVVWWSSRSWMKSCTGLDCRSSLALAKRLMKRSKRCGCQHLRREDEVNVLNFVRAVFDELGGDHAVGNVATDAESAGVGEFADRGDEVGIERTVELDLNVTQIGVTLDCGLGFGRGVGVIIPPRTDSRAVHH